MSIGRASTGLSGQTRNTTLFGSPREPMTQPGLAHRLNRFWIGSERSERVSRHRHFASPVVLGQ